MMGSKLLFAMVLVLGRLAGGAAWGLAAESSPEFISDDVRALKAGEGPVRLLLTVGEEKIYDLDFAANAGSAGISIGNPRVLATTLIKLPGRKEQLAVRPLVPGTTTLVSRDENGEVKLRLEAEVLPVNLFRLAPELREALRNIDGVHVRQAGAMLLVEGAVATPEQAGLVQRLVSNQRYLAFVINHTVLSPQFYAGLAQKVNEELRKFAPDAHARAVGEQLWLEGEVDELAGARRAERVAELLLPEMLPAHPLASDPAARSLSPRSRVQNFLKIRKP